MVVVFPTPFTPTTIITYGFFPSGKTKPSVSAVLFSVSRDAISSLNMSFSSFTVTYLSRATRFSIRSIMFSVVSTPTSDVTKTSSKRSSTSSSTLDLPATARVSFPKKLSFVFSSPLSSVSFFSFEKKLKIPIRLLFNVHYKHKDSER